MKNLKYYLSWTVRIIIFLLFMVSAVAKMFPIWPFEKQLVDLGIASWCQATYLARLIIALELAIGIGILQNHFIKRIIIPCTVLLLTAFCIHLAMQMYQFGAMNGNCGCFGQLIPMTPLEAFIKNIITMGLLFYLYRNVAEKEKGQNKFSYLLLIFLSCALFMFVFFPFCPCPKQENPVVNTISEDSFQNEVPATIPTVDSTPIEVAGALPVKDTSKNVAVKKEAEPVEIVEVGPAKVKSKFAAYSTFGNKKVNMDEGKKIVCMFAAGCDHCREAAKGICALSKNGKFPEVYILFMNEETNLIPAFFKEAQCKFPYQVIDIPKFWELIGMGSNTPGVFYLSNGNIIKSFEGADKNKVDPESLRKALGF